jgi:hypothetical protein
MKQFLLTQQISIIYLILKNFGNTPTVVRSSSSIYHIVLKNKTINSYTEWDNVKKIITK